MIRNLFKNMYFFYQSFLMICLLTGFFSVENHPSSNFHPLHVSTTTINFNPQDNQTEVTCTIFTDDFEAAIEKQFKTKTDLSKPEMHQAMDILVKKYISDHLHIKAGNDVLPLNYLGYEIEREAVNVYLESPKIPQPKTVVADVSLLYNLFDDQIEIVHIIVNGVRKSDKVDYPSTRVVQEF